MPGSSRTLKIIRDVEIVVAYLRTSHFARVILRSSSRRLIDSSALTTELSGIAHYRDTFLLSLILIRGYRGVTAGFPRSPVPWCPTGTRAFAEAAGRPSTGKEAALAAESDAKGDKVLIL